MINYLWNENAKPTKTNLSPGHALDAETGIGSSDVADKTNYIDQMDKIIRHGFIRKVMAVVCIQLLVTFGVILLFNMNESVKAYMDVHTGHGLPIFWTAFVVSLVCIIALSCCADQARTHPNNVIFLSFFTIAESVLLGVACAAYDVEAIATAMGITAAIVFTLVLFASQTKYDFTGYGPYLYTALWILFLYGIIFSAFRLDVTHTAYSILGVVLFSFYLVYDIQLIMGGKHNRYRFSIDEWVFAALNIYLDIINIFVRILRLMSKK